MSATAFFSKQRNQAMQIAEELNEENSRLAKRIKELEAALREACSEVVRLSVLTPDDYDSSRLAGWLRVLEGNDG